MATTAILFLLVIVTVTPRFFPAIWDWIVGGHDGRIVVNSPTVYTRQRLVNDRLSQTLWLQRQLKAADEIGDSPNFRSIDAVRHSIDERTLNLGVGNTRPSTGQAPSESKEGQQKDAGTLDSPRPSTPSVDVLVQPTTTALFRAKNAFRNLVRTEMMQTQLDDRHDIRGNTVYRLAFDAAILAGSRTDDLAGIEITLSHDPNNALEKDLYNDDYRQLYTDWIRYMQSFLAESSVSIAQLLVTGKSEPRLRSLFSRFLVSRICEFLLGERALKNAIDPGCDPRHSDNKDAVQQKKAEDQRINAEKLIKLFVDGHIKLLEKISEAEFSKSLVQSVRIRPPDEKKRLDYAYSSARYACRNRPEIGLVELGFAEDEIVPKPEPLPKDNLPQIQKPAFPPTQGPLTSSDKSIACPKNISPNERLIAGILLYDRMLNFFSLRRPFVPSLLPLQLTELEDDRLKESCVILTEDRSSCVPPSLDFQEARCFAVDFLRTNLNAFDRPQAKPWERIGHFLRLDIVGREVKDCRLSVLGYEDDTHLDELRKHLNVGTEVFSYGVNPKTLTQNISTAAEIRDAFQMLARLKLGPTEQAPEGFSEALRKHSAQTETILAHPVVVGFGFGRQPLEQNAVVRRTKFGWIIAPQILRSGHPEHIDGQYDLAAVVSLPSWWRSVRLDISTCWISRSKWNSSSRTLQQDEDSRLCSEEKNKSPAHAIVRLPGMIQELSRKLGFEAVQEPYLSGDQPLQALQIGQPGAILLTGGRLWRSTEVTVGAQTADSIIVLPNMEGIIAKFDCVEPQWGAPSSGLMGQNSITGQGGPDSRNLPSSNQQSQKDGRSLQGDAQTPSSSSQSNQNGDQKSRNFQENSQNVNSISTTVRVWTSEGVAQTDTVTLVWPSLIWPQQKSANPQESQPPKNPPEVNKMEDFLKQLQRTRICPDKTKSN
jgi:hypothetical protein